MPTNLAEFYRGAEAASRVVAAAEAMASPPARAARAAAVHVALAPLLAACERPERHDAAGSGCGAAAERACTAGCDACCHFPVGVTFGEALLLAAAVRGDRELAARVAAAAEATRERPWSKLVGLPCPLLTNGACTVYGARPLPCRALASSDAGACRAALTLPTFVPCDEAARFRGLGATSVLAAEHPAGSRELRSAVGALLGLAEDRDAFAAFASARPAI